MIKSLEMNSTDFLVTKEYLRFEEFCNACLREKYIGICHGSPGVGKTLSARHYSKEDSFDRFFKKETSHEEALEIGREITACRTIFYTASVMNSPKKVQEELERYRISLYQSIFEVEKKMEGNFPKVKENYRVLVIIDEADRLHLRTLEQVRELYDQRDDWGIILIGMPGLEKKLARYPQLYSRVGFAHEYRPISKDEMFFILEHHWNKLGLELDKKNFANSEAIATVARITNGNFRLIHRLFSQIKRIIKLNELSGISKEVVEAARDCLVIGNV